MDAPRASLRALVYGTLEAQDLDSFLSRLDPSRARRGLRRCLSASLRELRSAYVGGESPTRRIKWGVVKMLLALHYTTSSQVIPERSPQRTKNFLSFLAGRLRGMSNMYEANRMVRTLKGACHACREASLTGARDNIHAYVGQLTAVRVRELTKHYLMQLSFGGRALPRPPKDLQDKAVEATVKILTGDWPKGPSPVASVRSFLTKVLGRRTMLDGRRVRVAPVLQVKPGLPALTTTSASLVNARKDGGRHAELKQLLHDNIPDTATYCDEEGCENCDTSLPGYAPFKDRVRCQLVAMGRTISSLPHQMESRSVALPELGWKTRVVSCSDTVRIHKSESYRRQLFELLKRLPCCAPSLADDTDTLHFRRISGRDVRVYSADLKSATDLLDHSTIAAFCEVLELPFEMVTGGTIDGRPITRGTLMGIPCSWPILSLAHAWACWAVGIPLESFHLKGDDLIGLWTLDEIQRYQNAIGFLTGMALNHDKSFVSKDRGVFCERAYSRNGSSLVADVQSFSVRFLVDNEPKEERFPYPLRVRQRLWSLARRDRWKLLVTIDRHWAGVSPRLGGLAYLPVSLGGLEVLPRCWNEKAPKLLGRVVGAVHDSTCPRRTIEALRFAWSKSYPLESAERLSAELYSMVTMQIPLVVDGEMSPSETDHLAKLREVYDLWAHWNSEPAGSVGYSRYYHGVKRLRRRLSKGSLPQHKRRALWTVQGARSFLSRLSLSYESRDTESWLTSMKVMPRDPVLKLFTS